MGEQKNEGRIGSGKRRDLGSAVSLPPSQAGSSPTRGFLDVPSYIAGRDG